MIITQKFNSVDEIDPEFIPSLESLLCEQIPHFDIIRNYEKTRNENIHFNYFLFFGDKTNSPIGFAQLEVEKNKEYKETLLEKIFNRKKNLKIQTKENIIRWKIPGSSKEGVVFDARYIRYAANKASSLFKQFISRADVHTQELCFSSAYGDLSESLKEHFTEKRSEVLIDALVKNRDSYADFLANLPSSRAKEIQNSWKLIQKSLALKMGEYKNFKEIFEYKKKGALQHKGLKSHPQLKIYLGDKHNIKFLTLEDDIEVHSIITYFQGTSGHCFYDFFQISPDISESILHQQAILNFFEDNESSKLHFLGVKSQDSNVELEGLGFTTKNQTYLKMKKPEY